MNSETLQKNRGRFQLTPSQAEAVFHSEGPLLVLAGPGSGKTRVITHRIAALINSGVNPYNICAITFTNKAAEEMRQRVINMDVLAGTHISTFHSLCVRILRRYAERAKIKSNFSIYNESDQKRIMKLAVKSCDVDTTNFPPVKMLAAVSRLKNNLTGPDDLLDLADDYFAKTLAGVYKTYQRILAEHNALDFDDLLVKTALLLKNNSDIRYALNNRFKYLLIDEYQDINNAQYEIAKNLAIEHGNICVTGDPDQSIYRWRGADIGNILAFEKDWPDAAIIKLEENFRSCPKILELADKLISHNTSRKHKQLIATLPPARGVSIEAYEDEKQQSQTIACKIKELAGQCAHLNEIAVFYRVNSMSRTLEEAFIDAKIPYQIVRGVEFYNRKEIRDMLAYLKVLVNPDDNTATLRVINTPARGIGKTTMAKIAFYAGQNNINLYEALKKVEFINELGKSPKAKIAMFVSMMENFKRYIENRVSDLIEMIFEQSTMQQSLIADTEATENIAELVNAAAKYDSQTEDASLLDWLSQISLYSDTDAYDPSKGSVALMTLHAAKGLEFDNVFIIGAEEGLLPHERSSDDYEELEEERRLFFVGMTRAKKGLDISFCRYRTIRGMLMRTIPSQFLYEIGVELPTLQTPIRQNEFHDEVFDDIEGDAEFAPGQLIRHDMFGPGRIKEFLNMGENSIVVVKFNTGKTKSLMLKYANLSKVE